MISRKIGWLTSLLLLLACCLSAQEIQYNESPEVAQLVRTWTNNNRTAPKVEGWRVQIMSSTDRLQVEEGLSRFKMRYPDVTAAWVQEKPYYKLKVGAFHTRQEALAFIAGLTADYPGAYPAHDTNIHPRDFLEH